MRIVDAPAEWGSSLRIVADVTPADVEHHLTPAERDDVERLKVFARRQERAASRIAGKLLITDTQGVENPQAIEFDREQDRPFVRVNGAPAAFSISFTHSRGVGCAAASDLPVGVDLETFREIRQEMTRFFLSPDELASAQRLEIPYRLLHFWSAKEAAFKASDRFATLLQVPLRIIEARLSGLTFEVEGHDSIVETRIIEGAFVVALARSRPKKSGC